MFEIVYVIFKNRGWWSATTPNWFRWRRLEWLWVVGGLHCECSSAWSHGVLPAGLGVGMPEDIAEQWNACYTDRWCNEWLCSCIKCLGVSCTNKIYFTACDNKKFTKHSCRVTPSWFLYRAGGLWPRSDFYLRNLEVCCGGMFRFAEWWSNIFERKTFTSRSWHCCVGEDDGTPFTHIIPSIFSYLMPPQIYIPRPKLPFFFMLFPHFLGIWCFSGWYVWIANCCLRNKRRSPYYDNRWFHFLPWWCATWWLRGLSWLLWFWCPQCSWRPSSKLGTTKWVANFEPPI